jgi:hypothetical protein
VTAALGVLAAADRVVLMRTAPGDASVEHSEVCVRVSRLRTIVRVDF